MDILDIDEVLKDDSFIFLEEKTQDDVTNILQQWKTNNQGIQREVQEEEDQEFKLNTRTFTRPKRKPAQILEAQFNTQQQQNQTENINMQIGGLVTSMQKSFLQDTSPPPSICSSMDFSINNGMSNSLITSADFSNVSFFQTNDNDYDNQLLVNAKFGHDEYSLNDVIRDRKALENLTMSGDSTTIKDSNIAQIDEMSLLSNSTLNNSTDSLSNCTNSESSTPLNQTKVIEMPANVTFDANQLEILESPDELIGDTTFNLVDSIQNAPNCTYVETTTPQLNETFKKITLNETIDLNQSHGTPENSVDKKSSFHLEQSTPQHATSSIRTNLKYTPSIKSVIDEVNLSPITSKKHQLNETFPKTTMIDEINDDLQLDDMSLCIDDDDDDIAEARASPRIEKRNSADLLEASFNTRTTEEDFCNILDNFGKYTPTDEIVKIRKSVDSIKKKYSSHEPQRESVINPKLITTSCDRLLNRRSRLYDDISLTVSAKNLSLKESECLSEKDENTAEEEGKTDNSGAAQQNGRLKNEKRDRDRFKTIRIFKRTDEKCELNVPCIDSELPAAIDDDHDVPIETQRFSRIDNNSVNVFNNNTLEVDSNYATYKKPKSSLLQQKNIAPPSIAPRSLSRPRYISGLQKFSYSNDLSKAASADDLEKSTSPATSEENLQISAKFNFARKANGGGQLQQPAANVKSPMGTKAKSFHNLSNNFGYTMTKKTGIKPPTDASCSNLWKVPSRGSLIGEKQRTDQNVFKVPTTVSALRKPNIARKGLVRPSSGYYGSNSTKTEGNCGAFNQSLGNEHTSLNSTRVQNISAPGPPAYTSKLNNTVGSCNHQNSQADRTISVESRGGAAAAASVQQKTTGIPKPSGLRPPSNIKRSGLPRPSSLVRR